MRKMMFALLCTLIIISIMACKQHKNDYSENESSSLTTLRPLGSSTSTIESIPIQIIIPSADSLEPSSSISSNNIMPSSSSEPSRKTTSFTNKYGTSTTKCAHSGCDNYIASSGDTNCCEKHSKKCLNCGKYIDEDAAYCMDCLTNAVKSSSGGSSSSYSSSSKSTSSKCRYKEGGKEVCDSPCESGSNFCSYHKKYLDDTYNSLFGN